MQQPETVVITGASAGIGRATARLFGQQKARVGLVARGREGLQAAKREIEEAGGQALVLCTDVADPDQVRAAAEQTEREFGPIDVWINGAMATIFAPLTQVSSSEFRRATEVTYLGTVYGTMAALERMRARNKGTIVQVGSALAYRSIPLQSAYCGAKAAVRGFTDSLRSELIHEGSAIRITMVQLAAFNTPQFDWGRTRMPRHPQPLPPIFQPEIAAEAIYWAAHHDRRELWVGAPAVKTILAQRLVPWFLDKYLARAAYDGQQTAEPVSPNRPDNLFEPVAGDHGAHGQFDEQARTFSLQASFARHGGLALGGVLVLAIVIVVVALAI